MKWKMTRTVTVISFFVLNTTPTHTQRCSTLKSGKLMLVGAISLFPALAIPARLTAQGSQATISVKGTFQNGAVLSGSYVVDVTAGSVVSANLFVGSLEFNVAPRIAVGGGLGGIDVSASPPSVGDVFLFGPTACSTLPACAVAATIPGPLCSVSAPCMEAGGVAAHSSVNLTTGIVPLSNGTASSTNPVATLSPSTLTFATQPVGTSSAAQSVTLNNYGATTLGITSVGFTGADPGDFAETKTCGSTVAPGASCTISITFKPTQLGSRTAMLSITDNAPGSPQNVSLTGTGASPVTLSPSTLTFATQFVGTSSAAQLVTLNNYGTATLGITSVGFTGADPGDFAETKTSGSTVAPGASCTISITFKPTQLGSRTAMLSITDNALGSPQNVSLTGTGTVVELNPASLYFGVVGVGAGKNLSTTLTNMGNTTLNFSGITTTGTDADEFSQTNTCGSSVGAGKSCTITVTFRPFEAGRDSAQVSISDNGGGPQQVSLSGTGCVVIHNKNGCTTALNSPAVRSAIAAQSMVAVPSPTGPSKVGTRVVDFVDSTRDDPFLAEGIKRELLVRFWYPTPADQDCKLADYTSPAVWARFSHLLAVPLPKVTTNSCLDAPLTDGLHPAVVFTHGYTGTFTDYTFLYEDLASRGYVVASVDHTYEATAVEFPDGRLATSVLGSYLANNWRVDDETLQFVVSVRLDDLRFVLNQLQRINNEASGPFDGKLDMSRVAQIRLIPFYRNLLLSFDFARLWQDYVGLSSGRNWKRILLNCC